MERCLHSGGNTNYSEVCAEIQESFSYCFPSLRKLSFTHMRIGTKPKGSRGLLEDRPAPSLGISILSSLFFANSSNRGLPTLQSSNSIQQGCICSLPWTVAWELPPLCPPSVRDDNPVPVTCLKPSFHTYCAVFIWLRQDSPSGLWYSTTAESRHLHIKHICYLKMTIF